MWSIGGSRLHAGMWAAGLKVFGLLGTAALMLGAHHSARLRTCSTPECAPVVMRVVPDIHAGHAGAATTRAWSSTHSFRRVAAAEWGGRAVLDSAALLTVLKINRIDAGHAHRGHLLIPDSIAPELDYSPFPESLPELVSFPKFVVVSRRVQAFGAYENGALIRWGPTSTGSAATPTDTGLFFTNWKSRQTISSDDPSWILDWYVNFIAGKGVAFHEYTLPGRPVSHGCVRLLEVDAFWLYGWAEQWVPGRGGAVRRYGTPVLVMGDYDYSAPPPWRGLAHDPGADRVTEEDVKVALEPHLDTLADRRPLSTRLVRYSGPQHT
jgi:hypothetical protein